MNEVYNEIAVMSSYIVIDYLAEVYLSRTITRY
jgi:hypothetical protein